MYMFNTCQFVRTYVLLTNTLELVYSQCPPLYACLNCRRYTVADVGACIRYIRDDAPIIIHLNPAKLQKYLVEDTQYRNQFETSTTGGSSDLNWRRGKEDTFFNHNYNTGISYALDPQRPKYETLILSRAFNCFACHQYRSAVLLTMSICCWQIRISEHHE